MGWLGAIVDFIFGLIGWSRKSAQEKLGQEEVKNQDLQQEVKGLQDGRKIETTVFSDPDGAADKWLHAHNKQKPGQ